MADAIGGPKCDKAGIRALETKSLPTPLPCKNLFCANTDIYNNNEKNKKIILYFMHIY